MILVMKARETVMVVVMAVIMMVTKGAKETLCAAATTACSLVCTTMRRMTAVNSQEGLLWPRWWASEIEVGEWAAISSFRNKSLTRLSYYNVTTRLVDLVGLCWFLKK